MVTQLTPSSGYASDDPTVGPPREIYASPSGISGLLSLPASARDGVAPAVLVLHDRRGVDARSIRYVTQLIGAGIAAYEVETDANPPDGEAPPAITDAELGEFVSRAADTLRHHPAVDGDRIALLGFGHGGRAALIAARQLDATVGFSAQALLYPGCDAFPRGTTSFAATPTLILHGDDDPLNTPEACDGLAEDLRRSAPARVARFEFVTYGWDIPSSEGGATAKEWRPDLGASVAIRAWPDLADMSAAQVAGFLHASLQPSRRARR
jgi:dienelactone hydrolase